MTTLDTTTTGPDGGGIDEAKVEAFTEELFGIYTAGFVSSMIALGHRTDLFEAATQGPATSAELAERAGLAERYVREWLGAIVTAGIADYDPTTGEYSLAAEHAICLAGESEFNVAPLSLIHGHLAKFIEPVAQAFREGGGVPYSEYRPDFTDVMDGLSRGTFDAVLVDGIVPLAGGLAGCLGGGGGGGSNGGGGTAAAPAAVICRSVSATADPDPEVSWLAAVRNWRRNQGPTSAQPISSSGASES